MSSFRCRVSADICNKKWAAFIRSGVGGPRLRGIKTMALTVLPNLKAPRGGAAMSGARVDGGMRAVREASNRGRQRRASEAKRSPLHAGLAVRVDAAMAPACGRNRGPAT